MTEPAQVGHYPAQGVPATLEGNQLGKKNLLESLTKHQFPNNPFKQLTKFTDLFKHIRCSYVIFFFLGG